MAKLNAISEQVWNEKYRLKDHNGEPIDETVDDTFSRVARALAQAEADPIKDHWAAKFYDVLQDFSVLPGGRIYAGAGSERRVTLMNCYVMGAVPDSLDGIHQSLAESAATMKQGGGIGIDFSTLRGHGAVIKSLGSTASGPISFMDNWDSMCRTIMSAGARRGAMMGTLRCDHPDIEAFIDVKRDPKRLRNFNISVTITDDFMEAVRLGQTWGLRFEGNLYKTVQARDLWEKIMRSTYEFADPGVIFIDRVNLMNPLQAIETIACSNPCGEQMLPPYGACCLGSINLVTMVVDAFKRTARIDYDRIARCVEILVRMLDNVLTVTGYPLIQQQVEAVNKRRIGIGITGFADMLAMLGIPYSRGESIARNVTALIMAAAEEATAKLGEEKGSFPLFDAETMYGGNFKHRRNSHLTSIQPTGTISLFAGNVSSGIEPIFDLNVERRMLQRDNSWLKVNINDYAWEQWNQLPPDESINPVFAGAANRGAIWETAATIKPRDHLNILAACQLNVDSSISKTINCPEDISYEDFKDIYLEAYRLGAKCCTTYRPNAVTGSILSSESMSATGGAPMSNVVELTKPLVRPDALVGTTYRLKPNNAQHAMFITINDIEVSGLWRPFEVFINTKNLEYIPWTTALTRMLSAIFRKGGDVSFVVDELQAVFDPRGGYWEDQAFVPSIIAGIGSVIGKHLAQLAVRNGQAPAEAKAPASKTCPTCSAPLISRDGCWSCVMCSYSMCG